MRASPASNHARWLIAAGLLHVVGPLFAQDVESRGPLSEGVVVEAVDACMTTETIVQHLRSWLRRDEIDASIRVVVHPGTRTASFSFQRGDEAPAERNFDVLPQECTARLDAITLAIAIAIDPSVLSGLSTAPSEREAVDASAESAVDNTSSTDDQNDTATSDAVPETLDETASDAPPSEPEDSSSATPPRTERTQHYAIVLGGGAGFGVVPGISAVGSLSFELMLGRVLTLRAGGLITSQTQSEIGRGEVGLRIAAGRLDGCAGWVLGIARGDICAGLGAGASIAEGSGFAQDLRATGTWIAALGRVSITLPHDSRVGVRLVGDGIVPIIRPRVHVSDNAGNIGAVRVTSAVSAMLSAEILVRWP